VDVEAEAREAGLDVRFAFFSASSFAFISECGTRMSRRMKSVNTPELPLISLAGFVGRFGIASPFLARERVGDCVLRVNHTVFMTRFLLIGECALCF
jgi:hypothetical protein